VTDHHLAAPTLRFGLFLSQANRSWCQVLEDFQLAEELGYDHAWLVDHLLDTDGPPSHPCHEAWTLLAAIAARTSRIRLGVLVTSNTFRHPAVLMKQAVTVDHVAGGRLILGLGTGWHEGEHRRFGIDLPPPRERVERLVEAAEIVTAMMASERTTYAGQYYRLDDAPLEPRPINGRIPLLIAAHRPRMIGVAARFADQWDTFPELPGTATEGVGVDIEARVRRFDDACRTAGRDPRQVRRSTWAGPDVAGSEERFAQFVEVHSALGFTDFLTTRPENDRWPVLRSIARDVIPELRRQASSATSSTP
jgi:alkanesulfonate monooxygenase SsuD/methylene tetrahydromethanopterin reductase-like flavin-dependent oxidoreductase (luciferase family)